MGKTEKDTVARSVRIPADVDELLVEVAEQEDRSISYVIVKALEKLLVPRPATVRLDGTPVVDLDRDASVSPTGRRSVPQVDRHSSASGDLTRFKCGVCGQRTIGQPCPKHGAKHAEVLS